MSKENGGISGRIGRLLAGAAFPAKMRGHYRIELEGEAGCARVLISGADRVLACTEETVVLCAHGQLLRFEGEGLSCLTYEGGVAEIEGQLCRFFLEEKA